MIGTVLKGRYRIESLIGTGGMSQVYRAVQLTGAHRAVAVKMLKEEYEHDAQFVRRFQQEAQAVLSLSHENIVRSYDVVEQDGHHFIVLEYVEGSTIKERIRDNGPMPIRQAVQLAAQVLDALSHAHARGFIHRDVKPQNVIVTPRGRAKLTDFGIARDASATTVTFAGANILGSVHYLSPEQAKGQPVTVESDIYSLGATLYEMVTGQVPFTGETPVAIALQHLEQNPEPPIARNAANVSPALNEVILKALRKDPTQRYHSAKGMRQDLLRALKEPGGGFVAAEASGDTNRTPVLKRKKRRAQRKAVLRIGLGVAAALALFAIVFLMGRTLLARSGSNTAERVPNLVGKTLEEATSTAQLRSYTLEVEGFRRTDEYEPGVVIDQKPDSGASLKAGNVITVVVNEGVELPVVPNLIGLTLDEANDALALAGLGEAVAEYRVSDAPIGTVYQQEPLMDTQVLQGDTVRVFISGEPSENVEMVGVAGLPLEEALVDLTENGFNTIRVRYVSEPAGGDGMVLFQTPAPGEAVPGVTVVDLTVYRAESPAFSAEIAFHMDVPAEGATVAIAMPKELNGIAYEYILYEAQLLPGLDQEVAFTAVNEAGGEQTLIRYVDGAEVRRTNITFG